MLQASGKKMPGVDLVISKPFLLEHLRDAVARTTAPDNTAKKN